MLKKIIIVCLATGLLLLTLPSKTISYTAPLEKPYKPDIREYSEKIVTDTFGEGQWVYFNKIITKESNWDSNAKNKYSTAYGLGQFLNSTWKTVGCVKTPDPYIQIDCTVRYIKNNYGDPYKAFHFHERNNHY